LDLKLSIARHFHKFGIFCGNGAPASHWWLRLGEQWPAIGQSIKPNMPLFPCKKPQTRQDSSISHWEGTCVPRLPLAQTRHPLYEENCGHLDGRSSCAMEHHQRSDGNFIENVAEHLYDISTSSRQGPTDPQQRV